MRNFVNFILYNNTFMAIVLLLVLSGGSVFAANEDVRASVRDALVERTDTIMSVDNAYIVNVNLTTFDPKIQIIDITEDAEFYYAEYSFHTIEVQDGIWGPVIKTDILTISKQQLGARDLGLYIAKELGEVSASLVSFLHEVQGIEISQGVNTKTVERTYAGLVGRFLDSEAVEFSGYDPVIAEPVVTDVVAASKQADNKEDVPAVIGTDVAAGSQGTSSDEVTDNGVASSSPEATGDTPAATSSAPEIVTPDTDSGSTTTETASSSEIVDTVAPVVALVGDAHITLTVGDSYQELGAVAEDDVDGDISSEIRVVGEVDVATADTYVITYKVADTAGNESEVARTVTVEEEEAPVVESEQPTADIATST